MALIVIPHQTITYAEMYSQHKKAPQIKQHRKKIRMTVNQDLY